MNERVEAGAARAAGHYVLDGSDDDLRRLLSIADVTAALTRSGLERTGIQPGWRALDCGCGPMGALPILADLVGAEGHVIGADSHAETIEQAHKTVDALHLENVELITADAHDLDTKVLGGPADLIYTRCFLMHQLDPLVTLRTMYGLLRPGGWLVVHEPLAEPAPTSHPANQALEAGWQLLHEIIRASGVPEDVVAELPATARAVGFDTEYAATTAMLMEPSLGFELHASTLDAARVRAAQLGTDSTTRLDDLSAQLRAASQEDHQWVTTPTYLDLTLKRPAA